MTTPASPQSPPWWRWPGLYAWIAFNVVATLLFSAHFDVKSVAIYFNALLGAVAVVNKWLHKDALEGIKASFTSLLRSPRFAAGAFGATALLLAGGFLVSSVHVTAATPPNPPVNLYRLEAPTGRPELARIADTAVLGRLREHGDFWLRPSSAREVWLVTSDLRRTKVLAVRGWRSQKIVYPDQFEQMVALSLLPMEHLLVGIGKQSPLRIVVREARPDGLTLAEATLDDRRRMPGFVLSFVQPPRPDSGTRSRWRRTILGLAPTPQDSASVDDIVANWADVRFMRATRDLQVGDSLDVVVSRGTEQLLSQRVKLTSAVSDVIIRRS